MNLKDLRGMLNIDENQSIEFKEKFNMDNAGNHICAFLNSKGGFLIVQNFGQNKEEVIQSIENAISKAITPKALFSFDSISNKGINYLIIEVPAGKDTPFSYKNVIYIRTEKGTEPADIETIKDMIVKKQNEPIRWERRFSDAQFDEDFDEKHFKSALSGIKKTNRIHLEDYENVTEYLDYLSLYKYGQLTNGGDVLFCKNPAKRLPQIRAKAVLFANDKTDSRYVDMKDFEGPLLVIYKELSNFIERNTPTAAFFPVNDPKRKNISLYPERAVREGLINALAHRDYSSFSGSISVSIYPNRMEIWNYGEFPNGVSVKSLDKGNVSVLRNPDIAHVLYLQDFMEKLGRGALTIKTECKAYGLPEPHWKSEKGKGVTLTFFAPEKRPNTGRKAAESGTEITDGQRISDRKEPEKSPKRARKEPEKSPIDLASVSAQEKSIIKYLKRNNTIKRSDVKKILKVEETRAKVILRNMVDSQIIDRIGDGKGTYYILTVKKSIK